MYKRYYDDCSRLGTRAHDTIDRIVRGDTEDMIIDEDVRQVIKILAMVE